MKKILFFNIHIVSFLIINLACFNMAWGETLDLPFCAGEKMTFQVRWSFILAGEATIELLPVTSISGKDAYHFLFTAKTSEFVDVFYKVRDTIESYTDINMSHSLFYSRSHKGKSVKDTIVEFDWEKNQAQYSRIGGSKKSEPLPIPDGTFDPLSVFFAFRMNDLDQNKEITIPVTDGKKVVLGKVNVVKRDDITVNGIKYDAFLVEPEMGDIGGVFEKSKDAKLQIWVTADDRRIPIRIKSKVVVGSFVADLTSYKDGTFSDEVSP
jgi:hypothetical protein